jgi:adenylate cyclase
LGALLLGLLFGYGLVQFRPSVTVAITLAAVALVTATACFTFARFRWWFPWLIGVTQIAGAFSWAIVFNSIQLYVQKKLLEQTLSLYLSPKLVKRFSGDRQIQRKFLKPGAEKQALTILFSDIASFTSVSEGMDSDQLARGMNQYFQNAVAGCIHPTDGTVVKYIGDAIFAFWNAPEAQPDHELRACRAALRFQKQEAQYLNGQPLITRIGLHTGVANVGNFGSTERVDYTALGENINLASRMEGLNKYLGTVVLATGDTYRAVSDQIISRCAGHFRLKGFEKAVEVHELIGFKDEAESSRPWREAFAEGLQHFRQRSFDAAETGFGCAMELHPGDGPARFYLEQIAELRRHPPPDNWSGEIDLKEK